MPIVIDTPVDARSLRERWGQDLELVAARQDWGLALMALAWVHFCYGFFRQWLELSGWKTGWVLAAVWATELTILALAFRLIAGRHWTRSHPAAMAIWGTWLSCVVVGLVVTCWNLQRGLDSTWYQPVLAGLGALAFAALAWCTSRWLLVASVILCVAGFLMNIAPGMASLIDATAWWVALQAIGAGLAGRRSLVLARPRVAPIASTVRVHIPRHHRRSRAQY